MFYQPSLTPAWIGINFLLKQGAASPEELVKRLGGSRVITKILIANNGIAAVSTTISVI